MSLFERRRHITRDCDSHPAEREMIGFPPDEGGHQHALRGNPPEMAEGEVVLGFTHDEGGNQDA